MVLCPWTAILSKSPSSVSDFQLSRQQFCLRATLALSAFRNTTHTYVLMRSVSPGYGGSCWLLWQHHLDPNMMYLLLGWHLHRASVTVTLLGPITRHTPHETVQLNARTPVNIICTSCHSKSEGKICNNNSTWALNCFVSVWIQLLALSETDCVPFYQSYLDKSADLSTILLCGCHRDRQSAEHQYTCDL